MNHGVTLTVPPRYNSHVKFRDLFSRRCVSR